MKLISINIKNFRSIEDVTFDIHPVDGGYTYSLIGINESGKSSFLKAISAVKNVEEIRYPKDYPNRTRPVEIFLEYELLPKEEEQFKNDLTALGFDEEIIGQIKVKSFTLKTKFEPASGAQKNVFGKIIFHKNRFNKYMLIVDKGI